MLEKLRQEVLEANLDLVTKNLVISTWGNVSGFDPESGLMVIKASGVPYSSMTVDDMVIVDLDGNVIDSEKRPSTDTPTHIHLYRHFAEKGIRGVVHTHSQYATAWAQLGRGIPCLGTTHGDYFYGEIPCTRKLSADEISEAYELNTGKVIVETINGRSDCIRMSAALAYRHAPFVWGKSPADAVLHSQVLEYLAKMALLDELVDPGIKPLEKEIADKHYNRKFGPDAYYGQS